MMFGRLFLLCLLLCQGTWGYEISIISMFRNEGPYLKEWIEYHRIAGVEHFYLYNNNSTDNSLAVLQPYLDEGLVELIDWPYTLPNGCSFTPIQVDAFKDGIKVSQGKSNWVALIDIDEFIVPLKNQTIGECLKKNFPNANAIYVNWRNFGTSYTTIPLGDPLITKLIWCSMPSHSDNGIGKSIIRPEAVDINKAWYPHHFVLKDGYDYVNGSNKPLQKEGLDFITDGYHHNKFIVIHHYCLRDEWFYQNVRLAKAKNGYGDYNLLVEHYESFNAVKNFDMVNFLKKFHREKFDAYWGMY